MILNKILLIYYCKNLLIFFCFQKLLQSCKTPEEHKSLVTTYKMLTEPQHMGKRFKVFSMFPSSTKDFLIKYPPAGFFRDPNAAQKENENKNKSENENKNESNNENDVK